MLPVTVQEIPGTFELYQVEAYPVPTDHFPKTNMSTQMVQLPAYVAEAQGQYMELTQGQIDSCIRDIKCINARLTCL